MANIPYGEYAGKSLPATTDTKYKVGDQFLLRIEGRFKLYVLSPERTWVFNQGITDEEQQRLLTDYTNPTIDTKFQAQKDYTDSVIQQTVAETIPVSGTVLPRGVSIPEY